MGTVCRQRIMTHPETTTMVGVTTRRGQKSVGNVCTRGLVTGVLFHPVTRLLPVVIIVIFVVFESVVFSRISLDVARNRVGESLIRTGHALTNNNNFRDLEKRGKIDGSMIHHGKEEEKKKKGKMKKNATQSKKITYALTELLSNFAYASDPHKDIDIPVFFFIPKAGGNVIMDVINRCYLSAIATETAGWWHESDIVIKRPTMIVGSNTTSVKVKLAQREVIKRTRAKDVIEFELANVVATKFLYETNDIFTISREIRGRLFAVFRHPIDRAVAMYYHSQQAHIASNRRLEWKDWTIEQFAKSDKITSNWLTRHLSHQYKGTLTDDHFFLALNVIRTKFIVGLATDIDATMDRFEKIFRWKYKVLPRYQEKCRRASIAIGLNETYGAISYAEGSEVYELLASQNRYDLRLYAQVKKLFAEQAKYVANIPDDFRNIDATCCTCTQPTYPTEGNFKCPKENSENDRQEPLVSKSSLSLSSIKAPPQLPSIPAPSSSSSSIKAPPQLPSIPATSSSSSSVNVTTNNHFLTQLSNYADTSDPINRADVPVFFHIPKTGGGTIRNVINVCYLSTIAAETDGANWEDTKFSLIRPKVMDRQEPLSPEQKRKSIEVSIVSGEIVDRTAMNGKVRFPADTVVTKFIYESNNLFATTSTHGKGRLFTIFRHPVERAISMYYHMKQYNPTIKNMSIRQYAKSGLIENNWLTRFLSRKYTHELTDDHLAIAMDVLRTKFVVGLTSQMDETMERFEKFFRWKYRVLPDYQEECRQTMVVRTGLDMDDPKTKGRPRFKKGHEVWELLAWQNKYDLKLYDYIQQLFQEQANLVADVPDHFRTLDATCCKCDPPTFPVEDEEQSTFTCPGGEDHGQKWDDNKNGGLAEKSTMGETTSLSLSSSSSSASLSLLSSFADTSNQENIRNDLPVFFHVPKSGGSTVKNIMGSCYHFVMASEFGVTDGHDQDTEIAVVYPKVINAEPGSGRSPFVNVNTYTKEGIDRAKAMGLVDSGLADVMVTFSIFKANELFTTTSSSSTTTTKATTTTKGRLFGVFRHPIDRAISTFYYLQKAFWEPTYQPEWQHWTMEQYANSTIVEQNWLTKQLSNADLNEQITNHHLMIAMEVIRTKFIVGLMDDMETSMEHFDQFFQWKYRVYPIYQETCREGLLGSNRANQNTEKGGGGGNNDDGNNNNNNNNNNNKNNNYQDENSYVWKQLSNKNVYDLQLYGFIETQFHEQHRTLFSKIPNGYRRINETCCKCSPPTYPEVIGDFTCPIQVPN